MTNYRRNHYVPVWYQKRFLTDEVSEKRFYYLDLKPDTIISNGRPYKRNSLLHWGPGLCFLEKDLYTTRFGGWESTEIEQEFFGKVDAKGASAVDYFANFEHPDVNSDAFYAFLPYLSIQKLRTPKGLASLAKQINLNETNKNKLLFEMQRLQQMFCALWTECVWSIADASEANTKFLLSDHPVTVYNSGCFPASKWCLGFNDPEIWLSGTHTIFPLNLNKILILTNLSWVRYPYGNPIKQRPHSKLFRQAMFNFTQIQTKRMLTEQEVLEINYIIKKRANRYIAAENRDWLYPEDKLTNTHWNKFGQGYLLMPDPRSVTFSSEILIGYESGRAEAFDEYGRRPGQMEFKDKQLHKREWETFHAFQGEFARLFGSKRRGLAHEFHRLDKVADDPNYHAYHLSLEQKYKKHRYNK